jgi:hypothetical protein
MLIYYIQVGQFTILVNLLLIIEPVRFSKPVLLGKSLKQTEMCLYIYIICIVLTCSTSCSHLTSL